MQAASVVRNAPIGPVIERTQAVAHLDGTAGATDVQPVAAVGHRVVLAESPPLDDATSPQVFELLDPTTGERSPGWTGSPGQQDIVTGDGGDWVVVVRTGYSLPFADWSLAARNVVTGAVVQLAVGDPTIAAAQGIHADPPLGMAPSVAISGARIVWSQFARVGAQVVSQVRIANLETDQRSTIATAPDAVTGDLRLPAIDGDQVAWVRRAFDGAGVSSTVELYDLSSDQTRQFDSGGSPWSVALLDSGRTLAWDDGMTAKFSESISTEMRTRYAGAVGWGSNSNGGVVSWNPSSTAGGRPGFYDPQSGVTRYVDLADGAICNLATVIGPWFVWQELDAGGTSTFYFLPVPAS